jgi:hypothetical protein
VVEKEIKVDDGVDRSRYDVSNLTFADPGASSMRTSEGITIAIIKGSIAAQQVGWSIGYDVVRSGSCNCKQSSERNVYAT